MKHGLVLLGVGLVVVGLIALYNGVLAMITVPCFIGEDCVPTTGNIAFFPLGLVAVIIGCSIWSVGASRASASGSSASSLVGLGFFSVFGLTFLGLGLVMLIADRQPGVDHTTNVLTILGLMFSVVGILSVAADVWMRFSSGRDAQILATGLRGRATILAVRDSNVSVNNNPMISIDLRVEIPGQPVFTKDVSTVISRLDVASYHPGLILAVAADPRKPTHIVVDWDKSPIGDANGPLDPVTGQPAQAVAAAAAVTVAGSHASAVDVASVLRAAADQIAAGGLVSHPGVASAVANSHQWGATGQPLSLDQIAAILRTAANNASAGAVGTTQMSATDLATMLRSASEAASKAADAAEAAARSGLPGVPGS